MAVKLILTQIMKNESHVAERMLNSIKGFVDGICVVDTGSTDDSIEKVLKWGKDNNIETYVFEKAFDNFESCRNYSFEKAREKFLNRDNNTYYNFWLDFDEELVVDPTFNKNTLNKDLYMFNTYIRQMKYTRNEMCRLDKAYRFYGPIHEYIIQPEGVQGLTSDVLQGVHVNVSMDGGSWKEDVPNKYLSHSHVLEKYIANNRKDPRWIFYTAQSYHDSATMPDNKEENEERLRRSLRYYRERVDRLDGYGEERFYAQYRIGTIMKNLESPWHLTHLELLKAYSMEPLRAEPIKVIIDYYLQVGEWNMAYLYSKFAKVNFHNKNPYPKRLLFVDESIYVWKILEVHSAACYYTGRIEEAKENFKEILALTKTNPGIFSQEDLQKIEQNQRFFG
jgi:glycosyltransferase involved in cell wall biosynthesis